MQSVRFVVNGEGVCFPIEVKLAVRDTVAVASDQRAEVWRVGDVVIHVVVAQNDIGQLPFPIGHLKPDNNAAVVGNGDARAGRVGECVERDVLAGNAAEGAGFYGRLGFSDGFGLGRAACQQTNCGEHDRGGT